LKDTLDKFNKYDFNLNGGKVMKKLTIMLICNAGMSTSLLVTKMEKSAKEKGIEANIFAGAATEVSNNLEQEEVDIIL